VKEKNATSVAEDRFVSFHPAGVGRRENPEKQMTVGKSFFRFLVRRDTAAAAFQSLISSLISRGSILMSLFFAFHAFGKNDHGRRRRFTRIAPFFSARVADDPEFLGVPN